MFTLWRMIGERKYKNIPSISLPMIWLTPSLSFVSYYLSRNIGRKGLNSDQFVVFLKKQKKLKLLSFNLSFKEQKISNSIGEEPEFYYFFLKSYLDSNSFWKGSLASFYFKGSWEKHWPKSLFFWCYFLRVIKYSNHKREEAHLKEGGEKLKKYKEIIRGRRKNESKCGGNWEL